MSLARLAALLLPGLVLFLVTGTAEAQNLFCPSCSWDVEVTPDGGSLSVSPNSSGNSATFFVHNTGNQPDNYNLTCKAPKFGTCSVNPTSLSLDGGESVDVEVTYSVSTWFGLLTMTATGSRTDSGKYSIILVSPGAPSVVLQDHNGTNRDRGLCFTTGAGYSAGVSCGDLFLVHSMPAYRTLGRDRALSLYYNSATAATGLTLVAARVTAPSNQTTPSSVKAILTVGTSKDSALYPGIPPGNSVQIVLGRNLAPQPTGRYPMTLEVRNIYSGGSYSTTVTDTVLMVNRKDSEYGAGWSLLGLEQLLFDASDSTKRIWVAGDGSMRVYTKVSANVFRGAPGGRPDSLIRYSNGGLLWYRRNLRHGAALLFDETGRHRVTENRVGSQTLFNWVTVAGQKRLGTITVPPSPGSNRHYTFTWHTGNGRLIKIVDPESRQLLASIDANNKLLSLTDPDLQVRRFAYSGYRVARQSYPREGLKGDTARTLYTYAHNARLTQIQIQTDSAGNSLASTVLTPWDEKGLAVGYSGQSWANSSSAGLASRVDGPLSGWGDAADVWVDRFGGPMKIHQLGLGTVTNIWRDSVSFPALATRVQYPHATTAGAGGRIVRMKYDFIGRLLEARDSTHFLDGQPTKATTYAYADNNTPDSPTRVQDALTRHTDYTYNSQGLTSTITDPRGHVTTFGYQSHPAKLGLVRKVSDLAVQTWHESDDTEHTDTLVIRMDYDANGNLQADTSAAGGVTTYTADDKGRITHVFDPLETHTLYTYDAMNRVTQVKLYSVKVPSPLVSNPLAPCLTNQFVCADSTRPFKPVLSNMITRYYHGAGGTLDSISDPRFVNRTWRYNSRGMVRAERDEFGKEQVAWYSVAGLLDSLKARSGHKVRYSYDNFGRRTGMSFDARVYADTTIPGDSISYTYDRLGRQLTAINSRGTITRTYYADGSVKTYSSTLNDDDLFYDYDATGARTRMIIGGRDTVDYVYSGTTGDLITLTARLDTVGGPSEVREFTLSYDALGRRRQLVYPSTPVGQITVDYRYDAAGNLRRLFSNNTADAFGVEDRFDFDYRLDAVDVMGHRLEEAILCGDYQSGEPQQPCGESQLHLRRSRYNRRGDLVYQKAHLDVDSLQYDASGNITRRWEGSGGYPSILTMTMLPKSNRLQKDYNPQVPYTVNHYYDDNGADTLNKPTVSSASTAPLYRWLYYDGLGRVAGYRQGKWTSFPGNLSFDVTGTACRYDADGQMYMPCNTSAPPLSFDGANVIGTINGWRYIHAPGVDEPLIARREDVTGHWQRELYFVTDGQGRQLSVGDLKGSFSSQDADAGYIRGGWRFGGAARNATGFGATRFDSPALPGVSLFRNRAYDSRTGRWTQEDPIGVAGGLNLYQFNGNDPVAYTDPFGLKSCPPDCGWLHVIGMAGGALVGGIVGAGAGAGAGTLVAPGVGTLGGGAVGGVEGAVVGAAGGLATANLVEALADKTAAKMASAKEWLKRVLVAGGIYVGGGVPDRAKHSDNPPEVQEPAKPPRPKEDKPDEEDTTE